MTQKQRLAEGKTAGGPIRWGYLAGEGGDQLQHPHPVYGPVLAELYRGFIRGKGGQGLSKWLNDEGHRTYRDNTFSTGVVLRMLDSGFGAGKIIQSSPDGPVYLDGRHEPVISQEEWKAYLRVRNKRRGLRKKNQAPRWWLAGLAKCSLCRGPMVVNSYSAAKSQAVCSRYRGKRTCEGVWIVNGG